MSTESTNPTREDNVDSTISAPAVKRRPPPGTRRRSVVPGGAETRGEYLARTLAPHVIPDAQCSADGLDVMAGASDEEGRA